MTFEDCAPDRAAVQVEIFAALRNSCVGWVHGEAFASLTEVVAAAVQGYSVKPLPLNGSTFADRGRGRDERREQRLDRAARSRA